MKKKLKDVKDVEFVIKEYVNYYTNFRPQKKLGGVPPSLYKKF